MSTADEPLLPRVARGDRAAMQACIDRYGGLVLAIASRFVRGRAEAEDATQEAFIALWRSAGRFDPARASERTFVAMIAKRRIIDQRRAEGRRPSIAPGEHTLERVASEAHVALERLPEAQRAVAALAELPAERREVIHLAVFEGLTQDEIATAKGLPLGTVKSHFRRGLEAVRSALVGRGREGRSS
ncbi:sigma-70 family RNA polymerase sigma factor [Myxococcota bacterium]|nr:sigma-70 family RNA polymerase sigma factor [Myxococcota bacterium]